MKAYCTPNIQSYIAGESLALKQYTFVKVGTVEGEVLAVSSASDQPIGILMNAPAAGEAAEVAMPGGGAKLICDAGISAGDEITTGADGKGELLAGATDKFVAARADAISSATTSANDVIPVIVCATHYNVDESDVLTTIGDVIQAGAGGVGERLACGASAGMVLRSGGTGAKNSYAFVGATECNVTAGTAAASKPVVLDANKQIDEMDVKTTLKLAGVAVTSTAAEVNLLDAQPASFTIAFAQGAANISEATITIKDAAGATLAAAKELMVWLSDAATGVGLTGTAASGTVQAKAASGTDLGILTAKKCLMVQTKTDGTYVLEITDSAKTGFYVAVKAIGVSARSVSAQMVAGNYG